MKNLLNKTILAASAALLACPWALAGEAYIESTTNQWFNTGYFPTANSRFELDFELTVPPEEQDQVRLLGIAGPGKDDTNTVNPRFEVYIGSSPDQSGDTKYYLSLNTSKPDGTRQAANLWEADTARHTLIVDLAAPSDKFRVLTDGEQVYASGGKFASLLDVKASLPLGLFTTTIGSGDDKVPTNLPYKSVYKMGDFVCYSRMKVYGLKISEKNENGEYILKKNFMPCVKDGKGGLIDSATGVFAPTTHRVTLRQGGDIMRYDSYIESKGELKMNTGYFVGPKTRLEMDFQFTVLASNRPLMFGILPPDDDLSGANKVCTYAYLGGGGTTLNFAGTYSNGSDKQLYKINDSRHTFVVDYSVVTNNFSLYDMDGSTNRTILQATCLTNSGHVAALPFGLFGRCDTNSAASSTDFPLNRRDNAGSDLAAQMKVYGFRIYEREGDTYVMKKNFIPCLKGDSAEGPTAGFKDTVTGNFHTGVRTDKAFYGGDIMVEMDDPYVAMPGNNVYTNAEITALPQPGVSMFFQTGYSMKATDRIELDFAPLTPRWSSDNPYHAGQPTSPTLYFLLARDGSTFAQIYAHGTAGVIRAKVGTGDNGDFGSLTDAYNVRRTFSLTGNTVTMVTAGYTNYVHEMAAGKGLLADMTNPFMLGAHYYNNDANSQKLFAPMKIYGFRVYDPADSATPSHDFRPVVTNGVPGLVDVLANPPTPKFPTVYLGGDRTNVVCEAGGDFGGGDSSEAYLEFDGNSNAANGGYIATGYSVTPNSCIDIDFSLWNTRNIAESDNAGRQRFLNQQASGSVLVILNIAAGTYRYYFENSGTSVTRVNTGIAIDNGRKQFRFDCAGGSVDVSCNGTSLYSASGITFTQTGTAGKLNVGDRYACMRLYGLKISEKQGGEMVTVRDFMPYVTNGVAGLYELCEEKFYPLTNNLGIAIGKVSGMKCKNSSGFAVTYQRTLATNRDWLFCRGKYRTAELSCKAAGAQYYQWFKNGVLIPGETGDTYVASWERSASGAVSYSVRPVYEVFKETVYGYESSALEITMLPAGFTHTFR